MALKSWEIEVEKCKKIQAESIPKKYMLPEDKLPGSDVLYVVDFAKKSGALTEKELEITESSATSLVEKMGKGALTAEEVVIAYLKRATIGQQLVSLFIPGSF
jgi:amidase